MFLLIQSENTSELHPRLLKNICDFNPPEANIPKVETIAGCLMKKEQDQVDPLPQQRTVLSEITNSVPNGSYLTTVHSSFKHLYYNEKSLSPCQTLDFSVFNWKILRCFNKNSAQIKYMHYSDNTKVEIVCFVE